MLSEIISLGKQIYHIDNPRELHRFIVFIARAMLHASDMKRLYAWYQQDELRRRVLAENPFPMEQVTRAFFYKGATFSERAKLIREHTEIVQSVFHADIAFKLLADNTGGVEVWRGDYDGEKDWHAFMSFHAGQRKEGLLGLNIVLADEMLYQMIFWFAHNHSGERSLYIGAMQGPRGHGARELVKAVTKRCYRYRTKNLILYMTQAVARSMGVGHIYAVTNAGYYAQNHVRKDRKLKTNFGEFWAEAGGWLTSDERFFELPLQEPRKMIEDVKSQKRNLYRKRYVFLDAIDEYMGKQLNEYRQ